MARPRRVQEETSITKPVEESTKEVFKIREGSVPVRIRAGAGIDTAHVSGKYLGKKEYEVDEVLEGPGSKSGWGHLVNGEGWVALDYVEILK